MPNYDSLSSQIDAVKSEITASLSASVYTAQDLVFIASALKTLGGMLGVDDIVQATADAQDSLTDLVSDILDGTAPATAGKLLVGTNPATFETSASLTNAIAVFNFNNGETESSFAQIAFRNADPTSSTDIIAYMDNGNDSEGWVGMGISGSQFDDATYGITGPGDAYIFANTKPGSGRTGNLVIATGDAGTENKIVIAAGGYASGNTQVEITPDVNVHVEIPTPSTSPTTGAITVVGGVGIQGDMFVQGDVTVQGTINLSGSGTTVETENLAVVDPVITVAKDNPANLLDFTFAGKYVSSGNKYTIVSKDASDGIWKFASGITTAPSDSIDYSQVGLIYDKIKVGQVVVTSTPSADFEVTNKSYVDVNRQNNFVLNLASAI